MSILLTNKLKLTLNHCLSFNDIMKNNGAAEYNKIRRIIFSTYHDSKKGKEVAFEYLEGYKKSLRNNSYIGLKSELHFYDKNVKEYKLTVATDVGDHSDFSGFIGSEVYRIDVTTNLSYKSLTTYEPLQRKDDAKYKIAVVDHTGDIKELISISLTFAQFRPSATYHYTKSTCSIFR